jgi:hypothetical protein
VKTDLPDNNTYQKLIDAHAGINGNLAAKIALKFLLLHCSRSVVRKQLRQSLSSISFHQMYHCKDKFHNLYLPQLLKSHELLKNDRVENGKKKKKN